MLAWLLFWVLLNLLPPVFFFRTFFLLLPVSDPSSLLLPGWLLPAHVLLPRLPATGGFWGCPSSLLLRRLGGVPAGVFPRE